MADTLAHRATYADLEAVPPHLVAEILHGQLVTHPRPTGRHSETHFKLGLVLGGPFGEGIGGPGGWRFLTEPELHLDGAVAVPELAGWRIERIDPMISDPLSPAKIKLAPDWVCEILSPSTEKYDRQEKREIYAAAGVGHLWLVDPRIETLEAFALTDNRWTLLGTWSGENNARIAPFDGVELRLERVWPPERTTSESE